MAIFGIESFTTSTRRTYKFDRDGRVVTSNGVPILEDTENLVYFKFEDGTEVKLTVSGNELERFIKTWLKQKTVQALLKAALPDTET